MALLATTVFEVHAVANDGTASDSNGGGFDPALQGATGVDMTQGTYQAVHTFSGTLSAAGTTTLSDSGLGFTSTMLGNVINIAGQGLYAVVTYINSGLVVVDRALGTFATTSGVLGGAFASPAVSPGVITYIQNVGADGATVYSITSVTGGASNGCFNAANSMIVGYTSNRNQWNIDARPTIQLNVASATVISTGTSSVYLNLIFDGNNKTACKLATSINLYFYRCLIKNFNTANGSSSGIFIYCVATGNSATIFVGTAYACEAYSNSGAASFTGSAISCLAYGNSYTAFAAGANQLLINCVAYNNSGGSTDGFNSTATGVNCYINCISESNGRYGFTSSVPRALYLNCSSYGNASGNSISATTNGFITVTVGSVFVAPASNNFALNNLTNQGALLRAAGFPASFPTGATANYHDIGAAQHQDTRTIVVNQTINRFIVAEGE